MIWSALEVGAAFDIFCPEDIKFFVKLDTGAADLYWWSSEVNMEEELSPWSLAAPDSALWSLKRLIHFDNGTIGNLKQ